jgi:N-acylneuraminate cytidylyltransferase/CMP-N,N'-diacetyllegionaminic acid synthase
MLNCLAIIPARKNSIGLKNKNKLIFDGKPLFFWPILAALKSGVFDKIVLTTDDEEIIKKSNFFKEKIIRIKRPKKFSTKNSLSTDYINHTLNKLKKIKYFFNYVVVLEPTSPLTDHNDIRETYRILTSNLNITSVVSVQKNIKHHPNFNLELLHNNKLKAIKKKTVIRRQDVSNLYYLDGSIYASKVSSLKKFNSFIQNNTKPYFTKPYKFIEIDDQFDFTLAELIKKYYVK